MMYERTGTTKESEATLSSVAAVRHRDDLEQVPVRVVPVEAAAAVVGADLPFAAPVGVGPVRQAPVDDAGVNTVEVVVADQERIVLARRNPVVVGVVE